MTDLIIKPADLSAYQAFSLTDDLSNHCLLMIRGEMRHWSSGEPSFTISLKMMGDFGCAEHFWSHAGGEGETWWNWLEDTDCDYFLCKLFGLDYMEFDGQRSMEDVKREVLERRSQTDFNKEQAREVWDQLAEMSENPDKGEFYSGLARIKITDTRYELTRPKNAAFPEYYEMGRSRIKPRLARFWDNVWRPFITQAKATKGFNQAPDWKGFSLAIMEEWQDHGDIEASTKFDLAVRHRILRRIPGGYNPEEHEDAQGICPEPGDPWFELNN